MRRYLTNIIDDIMQREIEEIHESVDTQVTQSFHKNLKETSEQFSKLAVDKIKTVILEACHDMIHEHFDNFNLSLSTEQFRTIIADVIKTEFGGKLNGKTPKPPRGTTKYLTLLFIQTYKHVFLLTFILSIFI